MNQKGVVVDDVNWPYGSDEQAQSQDRERLQEDIQEAWSRVYAEFGFSQASEQSELAAADIKLLKYALGVK